ncbi:head-tail connector protein [Paenibacillus sp. FSL R7-0333]|uniref:head-tail connector protein n=1 Tax=Paenibacillus sp. FSL R7-0333 TaxID=1926587 RepID=UPI00096CF1B3|nr:hypothetical protein BK146_16625 [Paenibacillus sp. FSL R7-0333]
MLNLPLTELRSYLRDDDTEDWLLELLVESAKEYLSKGGVSDGENGTARYKLAVLLYCSIYSEHRDSAEKIEKFNVSLESLILQLKTG